MNKFTALILILLLGPVLGGIYGIAHDQLTFTISEEYYTKFKFVQFGLGEWGMGENIGTEQEPEIQLTNPRLGATIVGILATWWVGLFIGFVLGFIGLLHRNGKLMFGITLKAIVLTMCIALMIGVAGLVYGKIFLVENPPYWYYPSNLIHKESFILVGSMHNFSYLGGLIGLVGGIIYSVKLRRKT